MCLDAQNSKNTFSGVVNCDRGCGGVGTSGIDFGDGVVVFECWTRFLLCLKWSFKRALFNKPSLHII